MPIGCISSLETSVFRSFVLLKYFVFSLSELLIYSAAYQKVHFKIFATLFVLVIEVEIIAVPKTTKIMLLKYNLEATVIIAIYVLRLNIPLADIGTLKFSPPYQIPFLNLDIGSYSVFCFVLFFLFFFS